MNAGRRAVLAVALLGTTALMTGCGVIEEGIDAISATTTTVAGAQPAPGGGSPNANAVVCATERNVFELAVESYTILKGAAPVSEASMVPDWLRAESPLFDLAPDGTVIPAPGAGC